MKNTPSPSLKSPFVADPLGIHGKLHVMPTGHGMQENGTFSKIEYATRRLKRFALQEMAKHTSRNGREKRKNDVRSSGA